MAFNHYAKIKQILANYSDWYIVKIDQPTSAKNFKGEVKKFDHYYRIYSKDGQPIKYCKFQQLDLFYKTMGVVSSSKIDLN
jgi:hypothetical protein